MKNIFKYLLVALVTSWIVTSCNDDDYNNWTTPDPAFQLYDTTLGSNVLYATMEENPFILTWDKAVSGPYSVVISTTEEFENKVELGTSDTNTFKTTIGALNTAMLQAGLNPYSPQTVYIRIEAGNAVSNTISFTVTPYPSEVPVITNPTSGSNLVLDAAHPTENATTITWDDYTYAVDANYTVEIAAKGATDFTVIGTTINDKQLKISNFDLNEAALKASLPVGVASETDIRVTASTISTGGNLEKVSQIVTFKLTPYQPVYIPFYLVGDASAVGWDAATAQLLNQNNEVSEIYTYLTNNGSFRFLGQQDWGPLNYSLNAPDMNDDYKYFNTWSSNLEASTPENIKFIGNSGIYKITINQNARSIEATPSALPNVPENIYLVGSLNNWDAANSLVMNKVGDGVFEYSISIPDNAEFKFIGQQDWGDLEWGNIHSGGNSGYLGPKGDNDNIKFSGGGNLYTIRVNFKLGTYTISQ